MPKANGTAGSQFESQMRKALKQIGFRDIDGGANFRVGGHQIDACGGWDDVLVVLECTQSTRENASIHDLISEVRGKQPAIRKGFRKLDDYETYKRFEFAIVTRGIRYTDGDRETARRKPTVHLIDARTIEYYERLVSRIGKQGALFNLLGELQIEPQEFDLPRVPALKVSLGKNMPGYLFWCEPRELLKIAYVARREAGRDWYYQRMISKQRLNAIKTFIEHGNVFPNNVIVTFDKRPQFRPKKPLDNSWPSWLDFGELIFPRSYRSAWVIDGQHRLYAFGRLTPNASTQKVAVFAFEALSEARQAKFFIEINKEQKRISSDLIWDLEGEMSPETPDGRIANCVKKLSSIPPLQDMIFLPLSGERKRGQLKMSGLCQDLQATGLLNDRTRFMTQAQTNPLAYRATHTLIPDRVAKAVAAFLGQVKENSTQSLWESVLLRPGGITVALSVYEQILIREGQTPAGEQLRNYVRVFVQALTSLAPSESDMRKLVREQLTSYAQRRITTGEVLRQMQEQLGDPEFGKARVEATEPLADRLARFERRLAEVVAARLDVTDIGALRQKAPQGVWKGVQGRQEKEPTLEVHQLLTLGEVKAVIERPDNAKVIMGLFTDPVDGFGDEQAVWAGLTGVIRARNAVKHGRRLGNRRLVTAYLETFERLVVG